MTSVRSRPPLRAVRTWRARRWAAADRRVEQSASPGRRGHDGAAITDLAATLPAIKAAIRRRDAISLVSADRPTWIGDRMRALDERIWSAYQLDIDVAWPHLWSISAKELVVARRRDRRDHRGHVMEQRQGSGASSREPG